VRNAILDIFTLWRFIHLRPKQNPNLTRLDRSNFISEHSDSDSDSDSDNMAPSATEVLPIDSRIKDFVVQKKDTLPLPATARARLERAGIDLSNGYPERPGKPLYLDDATEIRNVDREHVDAGARADKSKSALFSAAKEVIHLTSHIGTEVVGLQLKDLTNQQRDELALLIAERSVVFFRDQDITPQQQKELGEYFGEVEIHVSCSRRRHVLLLNLAPASSTTCPRCARCDYNLASSASG
jgi:hypothetical protein